MGRARRARRATGQGRFPRPVGRGRRGGCTDRRETRGARDDATARRERGTARGGRNGSRAGRGGRARAHMAVRDDERVVGGARGVPRPGGDGRGAARGGSDRRAAARECAPRGAQRERQRRRGRGGHRRARARRTCAFGARETPSGSRPRDAVATRPDPRKRTRGDRRTNRQKLRMLGKSCFSSVGTPPRFGHQTVARKETPGASAFPRGKNPPIASSWQIRLPPSWRTRRRGPRATRGGTHPPTPRSRLRVRRRHRPAAANAPPRLRDRTPPARHARDARTRRADPAVSVVRRSAHRASASHPRREVDAQDVRVPRSDAARRAACAPRERRRRLEAPRRARVRAARRPRRDRTRSRARPPPTFSPPRGGVSDQRSFRRPNRRFT